MIISTLYEFTLEGNDKVLKMYSLSNLKHTSYTHTHTQVCVCVWKSWFGVLIAIIQKQKVTYFNKAI